MHLPALFSTAHISIDLIILAVCVILFTIDAMRSGAAHATVLAVAFPVAMLFSNLLPQTYLIGGMLSKLSVAILPTIIAVATLVVAFILINRMMSLLGSYSAGLFYSFLTGLSATIVSVVMWLQTPALQSLWHFGGQIQAIFGSVFALAWLIVAFLILAFVRS